MFQILRVIQYVSSHRHSSLLSPTMRVSMTADWPWQICVWSLRHRCTLTSLQLGFFFYKEVLDSVLSVVFFFLFSQRTQQPATISTTTTRTLSPDTTPLMRTSEFSAERQHSRITWPSPFHTAILWLKRSYYRMRPNKGLVINQYDVGTNRPNILRADSKDWKTVDSVLCHSCRSTPSVSQTIPEVSDSPSANTHTCTHVQTHTHTHTLLLANSLLSIVIAEPPNQRTSTALLSQSLFSALNMTFYERCYAIKQRRGLLLWALHSMK